MTDTAPAVTGKPKLAILAGATLALTVFGFTPLNIMLPNRQGFFSLEWEILPVILGTSAVFTLIMAILFYLVPEKWFVRGISLATVLVIALWCQANILNWNYGVLAGQPIQWSEKWRLGMVDVALWLVLLVLGIWFFRTFYRHSRAILSAVILIQVISLAWSAISSPPLLDGRKYYEIDKHKLNSFSGNRNVIIMVLDTFQSDLFQELINEFPEIRKGFTSFTYYRNALAGYPTTAASIPFILSGRFYENSIPFDRFRHQVFTRESLPLALKKQGFSVHPLPFQSSFPLLPELVSDLKRRRISWMQIWKDAAFLIDLSLFRSLPHFLKPAIYNHQNWRLKALLERWETRPKSRIKFKPTRRLKNIHDFDFFKDPAYQIDNRAPSPTFKFYHLRGVHPPIQLDQNCRRIGILPFTRKAYKNQARCVLSLTIDFLKKLKRAGAFDNSLILIVGDHGAGQWGLRQVNIQASGTVPDGEKPDRVKKMVVTTALPLFLMKTIGTGETDLVTSDSPISLGDIPRTVISHLELPGNFPGIDILKAKTATERIRRFLYYTGFSPDNRGYLKTMDEYRVKGFSWLPASWEKTGRKFPSGKH